MTSSRSVDASSWSLFVSHLAVWCVHHIIVSPLKNVVRFLSNQNYTLPPSSFIAHNQNGHRKIVQPSFRPSQREHLTLFNKMCHQTILLSNSRQIKCAKSEFHVLRALYNQINKENVPVYIEGVCLLPFWKWMRKRKNPADWNDDEPNDRWWPDLLENCSFITGIRTHSAQKSNTPQFFRLSIQFFLCVGSCSMLLLGRKGQSHWGPRVVESEKKKPRA